MALAAVIVRVPNTLAARAQSRGGMAAGEAVKLAEKSMDGLRAVSLGIVDAKLAELHRLFGADGARRQGKDLGALYDLALEIIEASSGLPGSGLDEAARAVCDLASVCQQHGLCDWDAVDVHLATLTLLRAQGQTFKASERTRILKGLHAVTAKLTLSRATP